MGATPIKSVGIVMETVITTSTVQQVWFAGSGTLQLNWSQNVPREVLGIEAVTTIVIRHRGENLSLWAGPGAQLSKSAGSVSKTVTQMPTVQVI